MAGILIFYPSSNLEPSLDSQSDGAEKSGVSNQIHDKNYEKQFQDLAGALKQARLSCRNQSENLNSTIHEERELEKKSPNLQAIRPERKNRMYGCKWLSDENYTQVLEVGIFALASAILSFALFDM